MPNEQEWKALSKALKKLFKDPERPPATGALKNLVKGASAVNISLAMEDLAPEQALLLFKTLGVPVSREVLAKLNPKLAQEVISELNLKELPKLIDTLPPREAATVVTEAPSRYVKRLVKDGHVHKKVLTDIEEKTHYPAGSAGRLMTTQFVRLYKGTLVKEAIEDIRKTDPAHDIPDDLYIVERGEQAKPSQNRLLGVISIRDLLMCEKTKKVENLMEKKIISISAEAHIEDAAALISKYKFMTLPVTDKDGYLVGVIPTDDLMQVIVGRLRSLYTQAVGADAKAMEKLTPLQAARLRVPWLLGTMAIELSAGVVISHFDSILKKVILLASFLPVISAVSGNVGLQAAAITVRAVDTKQTNRKTLWLAIAKECATALLMAVVCGIVLGTVGAIWSKHLPFGIVIGSALTCAMLTAGIMGTIIPMASKKLGFDPATTAGPFETAFQDVVGFTVFLWLATVLQHWIS